MVLVKKAYEKPALLESDDLAPIRKIAGDGALDYVLVLGAFHFVNRITDLLGIVTEFLPPAMRRFEFIRRATVRLMSMVMVKMDLSNREYGISYNDAIKNITPFFENSLNRPPADDFESVAPRPKLIEAIQLMLEERDRLSSLDRGVMALVHKTVELTLPKSAGDVEGFHKGSKDPIENYAVIGTRYAYRTTRDVIDALRAEGFDDLGLLDLAVAISDANQWARIYRLLGLPPELFYLN